MLIDCLPICFPYNRKAKSKKQITRIVMFEKFDWKKEYTLVIVLNIIYIIVFYLIMTGNR